MLTTVPVCLRRKPKLLVVPEVHTAEGPAAEEVAGAVQLLPLGLSEIVVEVSVDKNKVGVVEALANVILYPLELLVFTVKTLEVETGVPGVKVLTNETLLVSMVKVRETACGVKVPMLAPAS